MKKKIILYIVLMIVGDIFAQTNYRELLVRDQRTYWATAVSLFGEVDIIEIDGDDSIHLDLGQAGMRLDQDGYFQWYRISNENDTLTSYGGIDTEIFVSHRTYELHQDTIFVMSWPSYLSSAVGPSEDEAYKILYITEQKMLLLRLVKNINGNWEEDTYPPHYRSNVIEYRYMKPQDNPTK